MSPDLDLETNARRELTRLIDGIDVDAPLAIEQPQRRGWGRPMLAATAVLALAAGGVVAVYASRDGSPPADDVATAQPPTEEILWSWGAPPEDGACPPDDMRPYLPDESLPDDFTCTFTTYANRDGNLVLSGTTWGPGATVPAEIRLRYMVEADELADLADATETTIETTLGDDSGDVLEWSAEVPEHVPELIDPATLEPAVDFFEFGGLDQEGEALWEVAQYAAGPLAAG